MTTSPLGNDDSAKNGTGSEVSETPAVFTGLSQVRSTSSTIDQIRRKRRKDHWKFTVPLFLVAGFFAVRVIAGALMSEQGTNSVRWFELGITGFSLMIAYLVYIKYTEDDEDGSSSTLPDKPS